MTDEEMAEEYVIANTGFNLKEPLGKIAMRVYLAGLKAKTQWHDLRQNPDDLPNVMNEVLVCYKNGYIDTWLYFKDFKHEAVIGWKYLPKPLN